MFSVSFYSHVCLGFDGIVTITSESESKKCLILYCKYLLEKSEFILVSNQHNSACKPHPVNVVYYLLTYALMTTA